MTKSRFSPRPHSSPNISRGQISKDASNPFTFLATESAVFSERNKNVEEIPNKNANTTTDSEDVVEFDMRFAL
jgi:hypothetical protein